jgi:hypothetical protein
MKSGQQVKLLCGQRQNLDLAICGDIGGARQPTKIAMSPNIMPGENVAARLRCPSFDDADTLTVPEMSMYIS